MRIPPATISAGRRISRLLVLLAASGCAYVMGLPCGDDIVPIQKLPRRRGGEREILGLEPLLEFRAWLVPDLLPTITAGLKAEGIVVGTPFFVRYCRVNTARHISELLNSEATCVLIGERPGLLTAESMSAYIAYRARVEMEESRYNVVSNISRFGTPPVEAAAHIVDLILKMLDQKTSGTELKL